MKINEKSLYFKLYNSKDFTSEMNNFIFSKKFNNKIIGKGAFGKVYVQTIPRHILYNGIKYKNIIIKESLDEEDKGNIVIKTFNGKKWKTNGDKDKLDVQVKLYSTMVGEMIISKLISSLFTDGVSPHFVVTHGGTNTGSKIIYENLITKIKHNKNYYYSEKEGHEYITNIDSILSYFYHKKLDLSEELVDHCIISIMHSMYLLTTVFKFIHTDLHVRNIFIKDVDKDKYFDDRSNYDIKYIEYKINKNISLYTRFYGFFLKIGDFGLSKLAMKRKNGTYISFENVPHKSDYVRNKINKLYPNYPFEYEKHYPDYFHFIRFMSNDFIGISKLLLDLRTKLPELSTQPYILNFVQFINIKKILNLDEILTSNMFKKYRCKFKGMNKSNTLVVNYDYS